MTNDLAAPILAAEPGLSQSDRADLWDHFHQSADAGELSQRLIAAPISDDLRSRLLRAKEISMPVPGPVDRVTDAMNKMKGMDPAALDLAEKHPKLLQAILDTTKE